MGVANLRTDETWTEQKVMQLTRDEVLELWGECPAVDMAELYGEYKGLIPNAGDEEAQKAAAKTMYNEDGPLGYWLGKAYSPLSHSKGDGYNCWRRPGGNVERYMRFATEMGASLIDGKPALMMYYGAYKHRFVGEGKQNGLVDEIRKLADGVYLGVGTGEKADGTRTTPGHFALVGPTGKFLAADDATEELI
jgi:hypothetical protein|tara:strand:- start:1488 stop:2066 length:579 start_codon:yes stop_codon:yes gene_type:complete